LQSKWALYLAVFNPVLLNKISLLDPERFNHLITLLMTMAGSSPKINDIFIVGGQPTITYNPRAGLKLEEQLKEYLETRFKLLSVTGPTKCGKTVLCKAIIPRDEGIWVSGGQIVEENDLWNLIIEDLSGFTDTNVEKSNGKSQISSGEGGGGLNIGIAKVGGKLTETETTQSERRTSRGRQLSPRIAAIRLLEASNSILIIDDFHYIDRDKQLSIVRALKNPIFEGLRVITIAVPHRAYDAVRVEAEMTGRLVNLNIPLWNNEDLIGIPTRGFPKLNIICSASVMDDFANCNFGSPH
jgi:hypothetical protein